MSPEERLMRRAVLLSVLSVFTVANVGAQGKPVCSLLTAAEVGAVGATGEGIPVTCP